MIITPICVYAFNNVIQVQWGDTTISKTCTYYISKKRTQKRIYLKWLSVIHYHSKLIHLKRLSVIHYNSKRIYLKWLSAIHYNSKRNLSKVVVRNLRTLQEIYSKGSGRQLSTNESKTGWLSMIHQ